MAAHALTVDLEDWHQLMHRRLTGEWIPPSPSVIDMTLRILDFLDASQVKATFFVVGALAEAYPGLVRMVANRGHEIGCHSYYHQMPSRMERGQFKEDTARCRDRLQNLTGEPVVGFRAPEFAVQRLDHWCFEVLCELGFTYDSSVFPHARLRYGIAKASTGPFTIKTPSGVIQEYPLATWDFGGQRIPVAGGGYFRLLPKAVLRRALNDLDAQGRTAVLYVHPYEFARGWLLPHASAWASVRGKDLAFALSRLGLHNFHSGATQAQLEGVLADHDFRTLGEIHTAAFPARPQRQKRRVAAPLATPGWSQPVAGQPGAV